MHVVKAITDNATQARIDMERARRAADEWQESWERLVADIGELLHKARKRPKGRRFITVLELDMLLTSQGSERAD
jgi:hypothetical protein